MQSSRDMLKKGILYSLLTLAVFACYISVSKPFAYDQDRP